MSYKDLEFGEFDSEWHRYTFRTRLLRFLGILGAAIVVAVSWALLNVRYEYVATAPREINLLLNRMVPPNVGYTSEIIAPLVQTINIAVVGTLLAILMALPVAYLGANNLTPNRFTYALGKLIIVTSRSVHVIIWALIFVVMFGGGALAGIFAVAFRSIGFVAKLLSEELEEIDPTAVEGVTATGANPFDVLVYGVIPQVKPPFIGIATYRWDINVREATIIGFVGAGGIGQALITQVNFFDWNSVLTILLAILGIVIVSEVASAYLRAKVR